MGHLASLVLANAVDDEIYVDIAVVTVPGPALPARNPTSSTQRTESVFMDAYEKHTTAVAPVDGFKMNTEKTANSGKRTDSISDVMQAYRESFDDATGADADTRKRNYQALVNSFYDMVTDFYRYGWGDSFHFAPRRNGEKFKESLARCQRFVADELNLKAGMRALDVGCGVGGPMREIARYSGAHVVGLNNHAYQVGKAEAINRNVGHGALCTTLHGDFMSIPAPDASFDAAYAIGATPHAPNRHGVFDEVFRILKPGGIFAGYEWCLTDAYDAENHEHRRLKALKSAMACLN